MSARATAWVRPELSDSEITALFQEKSGDLGVVLDFRIERKPGRTIVHVETESDTAPLASLLDIWPASCMTAHDAEGQWFAVHSEATGDPFDIASLQEAAEYSGFDV